MCGILGYIGEKNAVPILIEGLKKLEYRGYDSAGICISKNSLNVIKKKGRIFELEKSEALKNLSGTIGIAHTRWATHGEPNEKNAHPHLSCKEEISIVHNGIVENYHSLKEILLSEGHFFSSETDSEVIAHLIEKFYLGDFEEAVFKALNLIEGAFGLAVMHKNHEEIIAARRGSPLIVGIGDNEMFITSDSAGIISHTNKVNYLNDDEMAIIRKSNYYIIDLNGNKVPNEVHEIKWKTKEIEKSGFKHFMLKEIFEQPDTIKNVLRGRLKNNKVKLTLNLSSIEIDRIIIVACGTSRHSALIGKYLIEEIAGIPVEVDYASEFRYRNPALKKNDLVVAVSQSGETADTLAALKEAKSRNINTIGIINVVGSTISREVDSGIYLHAGPEIGVASTKAFVGQVLALVLFGLFLRQKQGFKPNPEFLEEINSLPEKVQHVLEMSDEIRKIARTFTNSRNFLYLGRGINFPAALEGALKLKEISYIHAEGYPAAEMKHGPIAVIDENMPVFFLAPKDRNYEKAISNMQEVKARGGKIIAVVDEEDRKLDKLAEKIFIVPKAHYLLSPIINAVLLQLFAYHVADLKGIDVDKPRNLAKSVTVE